MTPVPHPAAETQGPVLTPERQLLWDAAALIERKGWAQVKFKREDSYCVLGALMHLGIECGDANGLDRYNAAGNHLASYLGLSARFAVMIWNDRPGRTKDEVVSAMRAAAITGA
jgi:hypothetical protein